MSSPSLHDNEPQRLAALRELQLLDTPPEAEFDQLTQRLARLLNCQTALFSLIAENRHWFKSRWHFDFPETARENSFCAHVLSDTKTLFVIPDTQQDPRFMEHPWVTGAPRVRFCAGYVLRSSEGFVLGMLCVLDPEPRARLSAEHTEWLTLLGEQVEARLEVRRTQYQMQMLQRRHEQTLELTDTGHWSWDLETNQACWDKRTYALLGVPQGAPIHQESFVSCVAPEQRDSVRGQLAQLFAGQERFFAEFQVQHPDGHSYWIRALGCSRQDASGKVVELYGSLTNIDGEHRQMEAQEDLLEQLSLTLEASQVGWVKINPEDLSLLLDQRAEQFLGLEAVSWPPHLPHLLHQWVHPEDQQLFGAAIDRVLSREPQPAIEFRVLPPDHELRWLSCHFGHFRRRLGHEIYLVLQNITARKTAMQGQERLFAELQQERQWTQQARQLSPSGTWRWDPQTDHTDWTPEMYEMLGVSEETALGTETSLR